MLAKVENNVRNKQIEKKRKKCTMSFLLKAKL